MIGDWTSESPDSFPSQRGVTGGGRWIEAHIDFRQEFRMLRQENEDDGWSIDNQQQGYNRQHKGYDDGDNCCDHGC